MQMNLDFLVTPMGLLISLAFFTFSVFSATNMQSF